jgi:hypothetical protein
MCFGDDNCILIYAGTPFVFNIHSGELPPGFSGFVAGGTGNMGGIKGSVDVLTVSGQTSVGSLFSLLQIIMTQVFHLRRFSG